MRVQPVTGGCLNQAAKLTFKENKKEYENPVDRKAEKNLAVLGTAGASLAAGAVAGGLATCFINEASKHRYLKAGAAGAVVAGVMMALTLPSKLYDTKVKSFTREKEMDVFSRDREVKTNLLEEIDSEVQKEEVPLDKKISDYATMTMASNGQGRIIKGLNN